MTQAGGGVPLTFTREAQMGDRGIPHTVSAVVEIGGGVPLTLTGGKSGLKELRVERCC